MNNQKIKDIIVVHFDCDEYSVIIGAFTNQEALDKWYKKHREEFVTLNPDCEFDEKTFDLDSGICTPWTEGQVFTWIDKCPLICETEDELNMNSVYILNDISEDLDCNEPYVACSTRKEMIHAIISRLHENYDKPESAEFCFETSKEYYDFAVGLIDAKTDPYHITYSVQDVFDFVFHNVVVVPLYK